ncbi:MAG: co-chaperone GroES [Chloroflexi bacterium]|nr:co-chaperone GroES [Chloroflexota bacterium]
MPHKYEPLGDRVVVKPSPREEMSQGGLVLPETAKDRPQIGEVIAVGPGRVTDEGKRLAMELKVGDKVLFAKYSGAEVKDGDEEVLLLRESDVLARVK